MSESQTGESDNLPVLSLGLDVAETKAELALPEPDPDAELRETARAQAAQLVAVDPADSDAREATRSTVDDMGRDLQRRSATKSKMLQAPLRDLSAGSDDGGPVAKSLSDLRIEVERLDPADVDLSPGGFTRLLGLIPGIGTPIKRYFMRYESAQTSIDSIIKSLEKGRDQLKRDNVTLGEDQKEMRDLTHTLTSQVELAQALDAALVEQLDTEIAADDPRRPFVEEEILFVVRQRTMDLQQQLAVNQQGVLATEMIIRNNRELMRGVDRAIDVTVSALQVAVTVALALAHQKVVLDKVDAVNRTTSDIIASTAERLKTQGTEIHEQAAGAMLDMDSLRSAFDDINTALDEISRYRREALPQMASTILELDQLAEESEESIRQMEEGRTTALPGIDREGDA
ncbi:MAG: toxic anion resistance protein [Acidimicrobiia bacterium]|nr:toxic anion resistance protein [Acidimicrobiia bacterium]